MPKLSLSLSLSFPVVIVILLFRFLPLPLKTNILVLLVFPNACFSMADEGGEGRGARSQRAGLRFLDRDAMAGWVLVERQGR